MTLHYKENLRRKRENEHEKSWGIWCRAKSENYRHSEPRVARAKNLRTEGTANVDQRRRFFPAFRMTYFLRLFVLSFLRFVS